MKRMVNRGLAVLLSVIMLAGIIPAGIIIGSCGRYRQMEIC